MNYSRRAVLAAAAAAGFVVSRGPTTARATGEVDPHVADIVRRTIGIDTHNHVDVPLDADQPGPNIDLAGEMTRSGLSAICMTFAVDYQSIKRQGEAFARFVTGLDGMDRQLARNNMARALDLAGLQAAHAAGRPTVVQAVEGAHFLEGRVDRMEYAYHRGLRHFGLLHDSDAEPPLGDVFTNPPAFGGLTDFGRAAIRESERLGVLVDLAHASRETVQGALSVASKPIIISHTGLDTRLGSDPQMATIMGPRLISADLARDVADAGGVIGVWTHLADSPTEYADNIRALVDVVGVDHVCIGTDTKVTPSLSNLGTAGPAADPTAERVGERTNRVWADQPTGFYYAVVDAMLAAGFVPDEIGKIGGGNYCRVFDAATGST